MPNRCPIKNPLFRTRALIVFEAVRVALVLAIVGWWGWLLIDKTRYILALEGELVMHDAHYIPLYESNRVIAMVTAEAATLTLLVLVSALVSFWLAVRDIRRTRALQSFFASMAHELRTPLASMRLQVEGMSNLSTQLPTERPSSAPAQAGDEARSGGRGGLPPPNKYLERINEDISRLEAQLERGLELARSESGKALALAPVNLAEIWRQAALCPILAVEGKPEGKVIADSHAVKVIFRNIIENAQIHGKATQLVIRQEPSGNALRLDFTDNGIGCPATKKLGRLFAKGAESKGTGVGLYLIKALMKQMGGSAHFASENGFCVTLVFKRAPV